MAPPPPQSSQNPPGRGGQGPGAPPPPSTQRPGPAAGPTAQGGRGQIAVGGPPTQQRPRPGPPTPAEVIPTGSGAPPSPIVVRPGPRGAAQRLESMTLSDAAPSVASSAQSPESDPGSRDSGSTGGRSEAGRGTARGSQRTRTAYVLKTRPDGLNDKTGKSGNWYPILTNYFPVMKKPDARLEQWRVDFTPDEDHMATRKSIMRKLEPQIGQHLFDGTVVYSMKSIGGGQQSLQFTVQKEQGGISQVAMRLVGEVNPQETRYMSIFNMILRKCLKHLKLQLVGREYFDPDPSARIDIPKHGLELWPGYVTSIRQHEKNPLLCVDTKFKIIRKDSAMTAMKGGMTGPSDRAGADRAMVGQIVMTRYNNRTYNVQAIVWDKKPTDKFPDQKGNAISYVDYYKQKYGVTVTNPGQPLLIAKPREKVFRRGADIGSENVVLVPELCTMTGLTEKQRADFRLMADVAQHTRTTPPTRCQVLARFSERFGGNKAVTEELLNWNLKFGKSITSMKGRNLPTQEICSGQNLKTTYRMDNSDWGNIFRNAKLYGSAKCDKWAVVVFQKDEVKATSFVKQVVQMGQGMGFLISQPKFCQVPNNNAAAFGQMVTQVAKMGPQMIMAVTPNNKSTSYATVKKVCCVEHGVPSQVVTATILGKEKGLASIATKVTVQMAAKLGGEPWNVKIPMGGLMIVGYDSFHDTQNKRKSIGALVSTMNADLTRFFSTAAVHENNEELLVNMGVSFKRAVDAYAKSQGKLPSQIIVYRDGVGDSQIKQVRDDEVRSIQGVLQNMGGAARPKLTFVIVSKRINSRFFGNTGGPPTNPPSGTVIDDVVTLPERYDFFLISQSVKQGTVNPTSYNVILDESDLPPDRLQLLTYRQCHMYYNWPGTIKVPAVCQYAHKLSNLVGEHLHAVPNDRLANLLYYL